MRFSVDYPDRDLDRATSFFRLLVAIPILIVLGVVSGGTWKTTSDTGTTTIIVAGGLLFMAPLLMILFRQKYPRGMFDFVEGVLRWSVRVTAYAFLLFTDVYPPFSLRA